jgi:hypothetical protein
MDTCKPAIRAVVLIWSLLSLHALADSLQEPSTHSRSHGGQGGADRTATLIEAYRAGRPGTLQQRPAMEYRPDTGRNRRGPPDRTGPGSSGTPGITLPPGKRR